MWVFQFSLFGGHMIDSLLLIDKIRKLDENKACGEGAQKKPPGL